MEQQQGADFRGFSGIAREEERMRLSNVHYKMPTHYWVRAAREGEHEHEHEYEEGGGGGGGGGGVGKEESGRARRDGRRGGPVVKK